MRPDLRKVDEPIDLAKQVIVRDMPLEAEAVEQRLLHQPPFAHHRKSPRFIEKTESEPSRRRKRVFQHNPSTPAVGGVVTIGDSPTKSITLGRIVGNRGAFFKSAGR